MSLAILAVGGATSLALDLRPTGEFPLIKQTLQYYNARLHWDEEGATAVEYGVLIALIIAVIIGIIAAIGGQLQTAFQTVQTELGGGGVAE
jgi:pilus assembly protein Flp/PilA